MKWHLVHYGSPELGDEWRCHFANEADVEIHDQDICQLQVDAIVSPANSFGFMDGGLDIALSNRFGWDLQKKLQQLIAARPLGELLVGEAIVMSTGDERIPWLISAPTIRVPMKLRQSINPYLAMKAILSTVIHHQLSPAINSVAIPGLGTGVGGMSAATAAWQMWQAYREVILWQTPYPTDFDEAQRRHLNLNRDEIKIWD
ncbi:macro domain-containing protein [Anatilimnocola floriformis]|uniref:macro domain-containing protein n=1 Tax=Anatilimnocola floriformis TaxID=2948575 RepID=UPI0020C43C72|nr:macro domain-containing protein [Anatilimnocola floriformis]